MAYLLASNLPLLFFILYLSFSSSTFSDKVSFTFASIQTRFWSENVNNEMPTAISTKLSPLTKLDSDHYAQIVQQNLNVDARFCSIAKLACLTSVDRGFNLDRVFYQANSVEKIDPFSYFRSSSLKEREIIHLPSPNVSIPYRAFLPPQIASKLSFTLKGMTNLFPDTSIETIETTLSYCSAAPMKGEIKSCPKSLEEMISFSKTVLPADKILALATKNTAIVSDKLRMVGKIQKFNIQKIVACHEIFLPFATYYCHLLPSTQIYSVDLVEPLTRKQVNSAVAVCHMDTSSWSEEHEAFKILKSRPGQGEACHWMNELDLAWIADA